jgi:hypothetical protein
VAHAEIVASPHFSGCALQLLRPGREVPRLRGGGANPFIDPDGYKKYVAQKEQDFPTELAEQKAVEPK